MAGIKDFPQYRNIYAEAQASLGGAPSQALLERLIAQAKGRLGIPVEDEEQEPAKTVQGSTGSQISNILANIPFDKLQDAGIGGGPSPGATKGTEMSGPMNQFEANVVNALGAVTPGMYGVNPFTALTAVSTLAQMLGVQREFDPTLAAPTEVDIQAISDYFGPEAAARAKESAKRAGIQATSVGEEEAAEQADIAGSSAGKSAYGSSLTQSGAPDPSMFGGYTGPDSSYGDPSAADRASSMADAASGYSGGIMGSDYGSGPDGTSSGEASGGEGGGVGSESDSGSSDVRKHGGIFTTFKKRKDKITWGEKGTGGETSVFVPHKYFKPGIQNKKEPEIMKALEQLLYELGGR